MFEVRHYVTTEGKDLIADRLRSLRDAQAKAAIIRRLNRLEQGNFGDFRPLREGVHELRIDVGPGYRVYYARSDLMGDAASVRRRQANTGRRRRPGLRLLARLAAPQRLKR